MSSMRVTSGHPMLSDGSKCPICGEGFASGDGIELRQFRPRTESDHEKDKRGLPATFECIPVHEKCLPKPADRGAEVRRGALLLLEARSRANNIVHDLENVEWIDATPGGSLGAIQGSGQKTGVRRT